jgi:Zn-dependent peptidase ImmA (M78 family)|tara:strand:+ start:916 stop:1236 length:321 start_codon:yes stop_codon:yes gene_type:complete
MSKKTTKKAMELKIGGHLYKIVELPLKHEDETKELYGRHMVKDNIILINKDIHQSRKQETLVHEVLHAIFYNYGLEHKENLIDAISNGLFQLGVGDYLWKTSKKQS